MADVIFIAIVGAFFGICVGFVRACDRLIASSTEEDLHEAEACLGAEPAGEHRDAYRPGAARPLPGCRPHATDA